MEIHKLCMWDICLWKAFIELQNIFKDLSSFDPFSFLSIIIFFFIFQLRVELEKSMTCLLSFMCCWVELSLKTRSYDSQIWYFSPHASMGNSRNWFLCKSFVLLPNRVIRTVKQCLTYRYTQRTHFLYFFLSET